MIYAIIFFLAFWAGFSVRRSSICLVRATHEIIEGKPPKTVLFVLEAMAVALSITIPAMIFFPEHVSIASSYDISFYLFTGAALYGVGAAINGACALGTLNQLMNGKIEYLATIIGLATGFLVFLNLDLFYTLYTLRKPAHTEFNAWFLVPFMFLIWGFVFFQAFKFTKQDDDIKIKKFQRYMRSPIARDFISVSIFGFCSGMIYLLLGRSWDYTKFIMDLEEHLYMGFLPDSTIFPVVTTTTALIMGMVIATVLSKSFQFKSAGLGRYLKRFLAGCLMGLSVGLIPGGNDTIILHGLPGLALHAPVALMIMMISIAAVILLKNGEKTKFTYKNCNYVSCGIE